MCGAKGTAIWLRVADEQRYYTSGDAITGEVLVDLECPISTLHNLKVELGYVEMLQTSHGRSRYDGFVDIFVDLISKPVRLDPGIHRFPFTVATPCGCEDYPPTFTQEWGILSRYEIVWSLTARLDATVVAHCSTHTAQNEHVLRTHLVPVTVFPARRGQPNATSQIYSLDVFTSKRLRVAMRSPTMIPQAPELCDIKVTIEPCVPIFVKRVEVYLQRDLTLWSGDYASPRWQKIPIGSVILDHLVTSTLELDGRALGWGLRSTQFKTFVSFYACLCYKLCVVFHIRGRRSQTMQRAFVHVAPVTPSRYNRDLPSYSSEDDKHQ